MGPKCNHNCPLKREAKGDLIQKKTEWLLQQGLLALKMGEEAKECKECSSVRWKRQGYKYSPRTSGGSAALPIP